MSTVPSSIGRMLTRRQITAVSQRAINLQMKAVHELAPKENPLKHLLTEIVTEDKWTYVLPSLCDIQWWFLLMP